MRRFLDIFTVIIFIYLESCTRGLCNIFARDFGEIKFHECKILYKKNRLKKCVCWVVLKTGCILTNVCK